jgi:hypothetical protein
MTKTKNQRRSWDDEKADDSLPKSLSHHEGALLQQLHLRIAQWQSMLMEARR